MILLIDGYNVLKDRSPGRTSADERKAFLQLIDAYTRAKQHSALVIFDGFDTEDLMSHTTSKSTVQVVYSGKYSADTLIIRKLAKSNSCHLLISSDRSLQDAAHRKDIPSLNSADFWSFLDHFRKKQINKNQTTAETPAIKLHSDPQSIDLIMDEASRQIIYKEDDLLLLEQKITQARRPKEKRSDQRLLAIINKL